MLFLLTATRSPLARAQDAPPSVKALIPIVGSVRGANEIQWRTDVELVNNTGAEATVAISLPTVPDQPMILLTIAPSSTQRFTDVVGEAFGLEAAMSPLLVQTAGRRSVGVRAFAYGIRGGEVFRPEPIAITYGDAFYPARYLQGLSFSDNFRTNIGLANLGDQPAQFALALQRLPGRNLTISRVTIPPNTLWHQSVQMLFPLITSGDDFSVLVETFAHDTYVYASVVDNVTNEARFVSASIGAAAQ